MMKDRSKGASSVSLPMAPKLLLRRIESHTRWFGLTQLPRRVGTSVPLARTWLVDRVRIEVPGVTACPYLWLHIRVHRRTLRSRDQRQQNFVGY
jgi:hypothetical protein